MLTAGAIQYINDTLIVYAEGTVDYDIVHTCSTYHAHVQQSACRRRLLLPAGDPPAVRNPVCCATLGVAGDAASRADIAPTAVLSAATKVVRHSDASRFACVQQGQNKRYMHT